MVLSKTYRNGEDPPESEVGLFNYFYGLIYMVMHQEIDRSKFDDAKGKVNFIGSTTYELSIEGINNETMDRIRTRLSKIIIQS